MELVFWLCVGWLAYVYVLFPLALLALGRLLRPDRRGRRDAPPGASPFEPSLSILFTYLPEQACEVAGRIEDLLRQDYPSDKMQVLAVCDGGPFDNGRSIRDDLRGRFGAFPGSSEEESRFTEDGSARRDADIRLLSTDRRVGKTAALQEGIRAASGSILVFTDLDTRLSPGALRSLVQPLANPQVGTAGGVLRYGETTKESLYWWIETALKEAESALSASVGANGSLHAIRRHEQIEVPDHAQADLVQPVFQAIQGRRTVIVPGALAWEARTGGSLVAYRRKKRIILRALGSLPLMAPILDLRKRPAAALVFLSRKLLKWWSWLAVAGILATGVSLGSAVPGALAMGTALVLAIGVLQLLAGAEDGLPAYLLCVLAAQTAACGDWLLGRRQTIWVPTSIVARRSLEK